MFADAVHPMHVVRLVGFWAPKDSPIAVAQISGRQRLSIHGALARAGQTARISATGSNIIVSVIRDLRPIR
jgi:hypothetical protein